MSSSAYYPAAVRSYPESRETVLVRSLNDGKLHRMAAVQFELFKLLSGCNSLDDHFVRLTGIRGGESSRREFSQLLLDWVRDGLLRPEQHITSRKTGDEDRDTSQSLVSCVITCDRNQALERWLSSRFEHPDYSNSEDPLLILDDSRKDGCRKINKALSKQFQLSFTGKLIYFGAERRGQFLSKLKLACASEGIDSALLDFALAGPDDGRSSYVTIGANRNNALLLAGESGLLFSDDDHYYPPSANANSHADVIRFDSGGYPDIRFFPSVSELEMNVRPVSGLSIRGLICNYLGRNLPLANETEIDLSSLDPRSAHQIERGRGKIGCVSLGCHGARWFADRFFIASRRIIDDQDFYYHEEEYEKVLSSGYNTLSIDVPTVRYSSALQGGSFALAPGLELPPYFPVDRHKDTNFNRLLLTCNEGLHTMHLPVTLYHDLQNKSPLKQKSAYDLLPGPGRMHQFIIAEALTNFFSRDIEQRFALVARRYIERGQMENHAFDSYLRQIYHRYVQQEIKVLTYYREMLGQETPWWRNEVSQRIDALLAGADEPLQKIPPGFQRWILLYGRLLEVWPIIRKQAVKISTEFLR